MAKAGHNSGKGGPIDPAKLKSYVERIEAVEAEEADYKAAKKDIYVEVKAAGMRPKMVRRIVKERKKTEADAEDEAELELYRAALAMPGATYRSVSAKTGIPKSTLQRLVPRNKNGTEPKPEDGDDGITESCGAGEMQTQTMDNEPCSELAKSGLQNSPGSVGATPPTECTGEAGVAPGPHDASLDLARNEVQPSAPVSVGAVASESERVAPPYPDDDDLTIPSFLDRRTPAQGRAGT